MILIYEKKISSVQALVPVLEMVMKDGTPLVIVAEDVDSDALAALVLNKLRANLKVCAVKAPGFGENRKQNLADLAVLTGGTVLSDEAHSIKLEEVDRSMLGRCGRITITKDDTIVLDGAGDMKAIDERCETIKDQIAATTSEYEKEKLQERLAKLSGGVAVIKVGGLMLLLFPSLLLFLLFPLVIDDSNLPLNNNLCCSGNRFYRGTLSEASVLYEMKEQFILQNEMMNKLVSFFTRTYYHVSTLTCEENPLSIKALLSFVC
jgi:hypothetical protein